MVLENLLWVVWRIHDFMRSDCVQFFFDWATPMIDCWRRTVVMENRNSVWRLNQNFNMRHIHLNFWACESQSFHMFKGYSPSLPWSCVFVWCIEFLMSAWSFTFHPQISFSLFWFLLQVWMWFLFRFAYKCCYRLVLRRLI